jgi:hypothetical protein
VELYLYSLYMPLQREEGKVKCFSVKGKLNEQSISVYISITSPEDSNYAGFSKRVPAKFRAIAKFLIFDVYKSNHMLG